MEEDIKKRQENPYITSKPFILDSLDFSSSFVSEIYNAEFPNNRTLIDNIRFKDNLCHKCNGAVPYYNHCHKMYGVVFVQNFGWYIKRQMYEWGYGGGKIIKEYCPKEILDLYKIEPTCISDQLSEAYKIQHRKIMNVIENKVRQDFHHKNIGEAWTNETLIYNLIKKIYPDKTVFFHYRPKFLKGLELDVFIEELDLGFEYQGIQHYKPVDYWGGEESLKKLKIRDKRKRKICSAEGIDIIYFDYTEKITEDLILSKIRTLYD